MLKIFTKSELNSFVDRLILKKKSMKTEIVECSIQHQTIKAIKYEHLVDLSLFDLNTRREIVKKYIKKLFKESSITTVDGIQIKMSERSASKVSRLTYNKQQEITLYSGDLLQIASYLQTKPSHKEKVGSFRYYESYIFIDEILYKAELNIFMDANGNRLYDINKISQLDARSYEGYGSTEM